MAKENRRTMGCCLLSKDSESMSEHSERIRRRYVRLESQEHSDGFGNLSALVLDEGDSHVYQKVRWHGTYVGHLWGKRSHQRV